jgi:hypothetical protein
MTKSCIYNGEHLVEWIGKWNLLPPLVPFPMTFRYVSCQTFEQGDQHFTFANEDGSRKREVTIKIPLNTCLVFDEREEPANL